MVKLKLREVIEVYNGLQMLDGVRGEKGELKPYEFSGTFRRLVSKWLRATKTEIDDYVEAKNAVIKSMSIDGVQVSTARVGEFNDEDNKLLAVEVDFSVNKLKIEEFNLDKNAIPPTALAAMDKLIEET